MRRILPVLSTLLLAVPAEAGSLRFFGTGTEMVDRVKIRVDDPADPADEPGPPVDVGATDFTIEFWIRGFAAENPSDDVLCGSAEGWIYGNIVLDRDRWEPGGRDFGVSLSGGRVTFGMTNDALESTTLCGATTVLDGEWHHVALQRRRSDGWLWIWVDGELDAEGAGPGGDVSYPGDETPSGTNCDGGPCVESDPFLVLGAEKHDAGPEFPSFSGWLDELRVSTSLRYLVPFPTPAHPFGPDPTTAALYHFDEGSGDVLGDSAGAPGGPSPGAILFGASGPAWSAESPFAVTDAVTPALPDGVTFEAHPNPGLGQTLLFVRFAEPVTAAADVTIHDVTGRRAVALPTRIEGGSALIVWDGRTEGGGMAPAGVYFARLDVAQRILSTRFVRR